MNYMDEGKTVAYRGQVTQSRLYTLYRQFIVTFTLSSTVLEILPVLYAKSHFSQYSG